MASEQSDVEKIKKPRSVMWKVITIIGLILLLLIPMGMVSGVIYERQNNQYQVINEIAATWGAEQTLTGPVLAVPYKATRETKNEKGQKQVEVYEELAYVLPKQLNVTGKLDPEVRNRGIFKTTVYTTDLTADGMFDLKSIEELGIPGGNILWNKAFLVVGIPHTKGIGKRPDLTWQGKPLELLPGVNSVCFLSSGLYTPVVVQGGQTDIPFRLKLSLKGSQSFSIVPVGKQNTFNIRSDWKSPSFTGNTLPTDRVVNEQGFTASWDIPYFARNYGQAFKRDGNIQGRMTASSVGVQLLTPVDCYRESERAAKYAVLFFVLTFATYFLFEVVTKHRLHPFQYLLIGGSLCLFYLLLIAVSEVLPFIWAYCSASTATIAVISLYSKAILGKAQQNAVWVIAGLLGVLYGYLYILLQLEDYSLLFGAIGLFVVLAVMMYVTRNIDWYNEQMT